MVEYIRVELDVHDGARAASEILFTVGLAHCDAPEFDVSVSAASSEVLARWPPPDCVHLPLVALLHSAQCTPTGYSH